MPQLTWPESALFLVLLAASIFGFWWRFRNVWRVVRQSKKDPDFQLQPVARRIGDFLGEVMLQGKVISQRPLPGLAHALVFWGFCVFALVTANHFAEGVGLGFLRRSGLFGSLYFDIAAVFAVAVAVGISGLAFRRFVIRPKWLGPLSMESGIIALLIFLLMITYLATFVGGWESSRLLWWAHTLTILAFLPLIPHTKHLHLVLSPVTVFLKRATFSQIPPLVGDDDFGLDTGKDVTELISLQAFTCVECGRCSEHCPATNTGKILNPKEIALGVRGYLNQFGPASEEPLLGVHLSQEAVFQCTTCGSCEFQCPVGVQHLPMIIGLRRGAVNTGKWEDDYGTKLFLNLERNGNALGFSSSERDKFIQKQELPIFDGTQDYCLWLGCMGAYDPQGREIITALVRVFRELNASFGVLTQGKMYGRSGAASGERPGIRAAGRKQSGNVARRASEANHFYLPALRTHHRHGLGGIRAGPADRASQRISSAAFGPLAGANGRRRKDRVSRSLLFGPLSQRFRRAAPGCGKVRNAY